MLALPLLIALSGPLPPPPPAAVTPPQGRSPAADDRPLKALDAWLRLYRAGKIDFRSDRDLGKDSIPVKFGIAPKNSLGNATWASDLDLIAEAVQKRDDADAAVALVELAAIGIDPTGKYTNEMAPFDVRAIGERWASRLSSSAAKDMLVKAARGELKGDKAVSVALQTAGVKCVGLLRDVTYRTVLEQALGDGDDIVRVTAAEMLGQLGDDTAALALVHVIEQDAVDSVVIAAAASLRSLHAKHLPKKAVLQPSPSPEPTAGDPAKGDDKPADGSPSPAAGSGGAPAPAAPAAPATVPPATAELPESVRLAVRAAIGALGRTTWRADMELVSLLDEFRSLEAVPALIGVLERFRTNPQDVQSGKLSGLLLYQAHELLVSMTGAIYPADQPEKWQAFWTTERDKLAVAPKKEPAAGAANHTVAGGFCGIPVQGTRVVFVLDLSGSMDFEMVDDAGEGKKRPMRRLDFAKRELKRAMDVIAPNAQFNLITFNGDDKPVVWKNAMVPATEGNRDAFRRHVDKLVAVGGTNLWCGLEEALKIKSLVYGNRYASNIDELFVLSDGAPSVGEVQDPIEMLRLVQECNKFSRVRINTIFISSAPPTDRPRPPEPRMKIPPQELMRRMAQENGGKFREL